jgi:hypothetical protein
VNAWVVITSFFAALALYAFVVSFVIDHVATFLASL